MQNADRDTKKYKKHTKVQIFRSGEEQRKSVPLRQCIMSGLQ